MARSRDGLPGRRRAVERAKETWSDETRSDHPEPAPVVRPEIRDSWSRSRAHLHDEPTQAPLADESETAAYFADSPLHDAVGRIESELRSAADDGDLVVAVTDPQTRILWTYGGRVMRRRAESVNFAPGGRWDEGSVGTNALDLALRMDRATTVFSAEHYAPIVHSWVCWAAPVHDPATGEQLGVLDLSTTWDRAHPVGAAAAQALARLLERELPHRGGIGAALPSAPGAPGLHLRLLGAVEGWLDGTRLLLTRRQGEILALLALAPDGMNLERLHASLYGEERVSPGTLKAEVSHLRQALGGRLLSRPYRLDLPVSSDVERVRAALARGDVAAAVAAYGGDLVPGTNSPRLAETAEYLAVAVREALLGDPRPEAVVRYAEIAPYDTEVVERALSALGERPHPARAELAARLAAGD